MKIFEAIGNFFTFWLKVDSKYQRLLRDEEKRDKSVKLGVQSIIQSVVCRAFTILALLGLYFCVKNFIDLEAGKGTLVIFIFTILGIVVTAIAAIVLFVQGVISALVYMIYQFRLNKRAVRWVALVVWILAVIAIIVFSAIMFPKLG